MHRRIWRSPDLTTHDPNAAVWRRSSYSNAAGGECVEVADDFAAVVPVRDSKNPDPALAVPAAAWDAFIGHLKG